jgi:hypothetical protein
MIAFRCADRAISPTSSWPLTSRWPRSTPGNAPPATPTRSRGTGAWKHSRSITPPPTARPPTPGIWNRPPHSPGPNEPSFEYAADEYADLPIFFHDRRTARSDFARSCRVLPRCAARTGPAASVLNQAGLGIEDDRRSTLLQDSSTANGHQPPPMTSAQLRALINNQGLRVDPLTASQALLVWRNRSVFISRCWPTAS